MPASQLTHCAFGPLRSATKDCRCRCSSCRWWSTLFLLLVGNYNFQFVLLFFLNRVLMACLLPPDPRLFVNGIFGIFRNTIVTSILNFSKLALVLTNHKIIDLINYFFSMFERFLHTLVLVGCSDAAGCSRIKGSTCPSTERQLLLHQSGEMLLNIDRDWLRS